MDKKVIHLLAYITSSAIGCIKEPKIYGSLRLIETTEKIINLSDELNLNKDNRLLEISEIINKDKLLCMNEEEKFEEMLNKVLFKIIEFINDGGKKNYEV